MKRHQTGFSILEILVVIVVLGLIGLSAFYISQEKETPATPSNQKQTTDEKQDESTLACKDIKNHSKRYDCYLKDEDAQTLRRAVAEKNSSLCDRIDHVFTPHDVQDDINKGIIGSLIYDDEAKQMCKRYVTEGRVPR